MTLAAVATVAAACAGSDGAGGGDDDTVTMGNLYGFVTFDPALTPPPALDYLSPVYDSLVVRKGIDTFEPGLATEWEYDGKARTLRLVLRAGVVFTDGAPFDAEAVAKNFEHGKTATSGSWFDVYNAMEAIEVVSDKELVITFSSAQPAIVETLAAPPGMMVSPRALEDPDSLGTTPVGTGPWRLDAERTVANDSYVFVRNEDYWDPAVQRVDRVVIKPLVEPSTMVNALKAGQVDVIGITGGEAKSLEGQGYVVGSMGAAMEVLVLADGRGEVSKPLADVDVRRALGYSLDRPSILDATFGGRGTSSVNPFEEGSVGYSERLDGAYDRDVEQARALLAGAGYPDGFTVETYITPAHSLIAEAVAGQLADIGVELKVNVVENAGALSDRIAKKQSPVLVNATGIRSAYEFYTAFAGPGGRYNPFGSTSPRLEELAAEVRQLGTNDRAEATRVYGELFDELIYGEALVIPVFRQELPVVMRKGVEAELDTYAGTIPNPRNLTIDGE
ncbi:ABC transporter substrate-binding protein [Nocardioides sp. L-11A]|uniref:ABC transporter substrate-binding protein n=1 Tax=Nocardioides sp. L-11A TaxID=3043848 RepID=UPI00249CC23A|nr:ABC transporter substrate-binding protein [Nocardioides sp. L-11A]